MQLYVFVVSFILSVFGGQVDVAFITRDLDSCQRLERTVTRQLRDMSFHYNSLEDCMTLQEWIVRYPHANPQ